MNQTEKRFLGYGIGTALLAGFVYVGFVFEGEADTITLLSAAEVHTRLAASIPAVDEKGVPNATRADLLVKARGFLERARAAVVALA